MKKWDIKPVGDLCDILDSQRKPITKRDRTNGKYPYYGATGIVDYVDDFIFDEPLVLVGEDGAKWASGENTAFQVNDKCWVNNHAHVLRPHRTKILDSWLVYHLNHSDLTEFVSGLTVPKLSQGSLREVPVPVPPVPEQRRIVRVLDEAFAGLATAQAHAEKNLQNARALFESHLQSVFTRGGKRWVEKTVEEIAATAKGSIRTGPFGSQLLHSEFVDNGVAVLGIDNAVANEFRWGKGRFVTPEKYSQLKRYRVHPGDVLITIMGTCGRCAIVPDDIPVAINTKHLCCITLDKSKCLSGYLHAYFLHAPHAKDFLAMRAKGSIMSGLNMGIIKELPVLLPPLREQAAIVGNANALLTEAQRLESLYQQKLASLAELKKSLLHQAFSGQL